MSEMQDVASSFKSAGLPFAVFAAAIAVTFVVGFFSQGGALLILALGLLAAIVVDFAAHRPAAVTGH